MVQSRLGFWLLTVSILLALGTLGVIGTTRIRERMEPPPVAPARPVAVETLTIAPRPFAIERTYTGTIEAWRRVLPAARISSLIVSLPHREGDRVRAGDLLVKLDDRELIDEVRRLEEAGRRIEADVGFWRRQSERDEALFASGTITQRRRDETRRTLASYEASLRESRNVVAIARTRLSYAEIRAPFDGVIQSTHVLPGETAVAGQDLLEVVSLGSMKAVIPIPQDDIHLLGAESHVELSIPALRLTWDANVDRIYPALDPSTRTATFEVMLEDMPAEIQPGLQVDARLFAARLDRVLAVPVSAVRDRTGEAGVYVVEAGTKAAWRPVETGLAGQGVVVVRTGISAGDEVIVTPDPRLADGKAVWVATKTRASR